MTTTSRWKCHDCGRGPRVGEWREDIALLPLGWAEELSRIWDSRAPSYILTRRCPDCDRKRLATKGLLPAAARPDTGTRS